MQRLIRRLTSERERGATVVTFALFTLVMLGFVGLGVDGAAVFAKRQHVQTGADAAAFALAQEYALTGCIEDAALALEYAKPNVPNEQDTTAVDDVVCGMEGDIPWVRVNASAEQPPFFLQAVGAGAIRVPASATVEWGSPVAGKGFPLAFSECAFEEHEIDESFELWVPKDETYEYPACAGYSYPAGGFGFLEADDCEAEFTSVEDGSGELPGVPGNSANTVDCDWGAQIGKTVFVPVFYDVSDQNGADATYFVEKFAAFELQGIHIQQTGPGGWYPSSFRTSGYCADEPTSPSEWMKHCVYGKLVGYVSIEDHWELGPVDPTSETLIIRLKN
ncbi:TadE/TadG family type IV pilus assembly protein [Ornithinimicrobium tianjinense]|uniref:Putative Flp pilus-assembly TadG-like N-terminal domain-containing protein n=1 Tax=Ornithinimicrobium tianjinense TaxID=1195761 RepID=A0A917F2M5_9MICO|nr:pilus assembly protein TadG-related protein [Ornithinimicrobium tianjinense]GGF44636.1 hypothetical protein GCM10011366_10480 [Ornithinimicrobium tianjinense]